MPLATFEQVHNAFITQYGIRAKLDWVEQTFNKIIATNNTGCTNIEQACQGVFKEFLFSDLNLIGNGSLPGDIKTWQAGVLRGRYVLQIDEIVNIAAPAKERYGSQGLPQHQPSYVASSSINHRCFKFLLTDGSRQLSGIEYLPLGNSVHWDCPAGAKLLLHDVPVRRGLLMLQPENFTLLGGQVDRLEEARKRVVEVWNRPPVPRPQREFRQDVVQDARAAAWSSEIDGNSPDAISGNSLLNSYETNLRRIDVDRDGFARPPPPEWTRPGDLEEEGGENRGAERRDGRGGNGRGEEERKGGESRGGSSRAGYRTDDIGGRYDIKSGSNGDNNDGGGGGDGTITCNYNASINNKDNQHLNHHNYCQGYSAPFNSTSFPSAPTISSFRVPPPLSSSPSVNPSSSNALSSGTFRSTNDVNNFSRSSESKIVYPRNAAYNSDNSNDTRVNTTGHNHQTPHPQAVVRFSNNIAALAHILDDDEEDEDDDVSEVHMPMACIDLSQDPKFSSRAMQDDKEVVGIPSSSDARVHKHTNNEQNNNEHNNNNPCEGTLGLLDMDDAFIDLDILDRWEDEYTNDRIDSQDVVQIDDEGEEGEEGQKPRNKSEQRDMDGGEEGLTARDEEEGYLKKDCSSTSKDKSVRMSNGVATSLPKYDEDSEPHGSTIAPSYFAPDDDDEEDMTAFEKMLSQLERSTRHCAPLPISSTAYDLNDLNSTDSGQGDASALDLCDEVSPEKIGGGGKGKGICGEEAQRMEREEETTPTLEHPIDDRDSDPSMLPPLVWIQDCRDVASLPDKIRFYNEHVRGLGNRNHGNRNPRKRNGLPDQKLIQTRILGVFSEAKSHVAWIEDGSGILMAEVSSGLAKTLSGMDFDQLLDWMQNPDGDEGKTAAAAAAAQKLMASLRAFSGEMTLQFSNEGGGLPMLMSLIPDGESGERGKGKRCEEGEGGGEEEKEKDSKVEEEREILWISEKMQEIEKWTEAMRKWEKARRSEAGRNVEQKEREGEEDERPVRKRKGEEVEAERNTRVKQEV